MGSQFKCLLARIKGPYTGLKRLLRGVCVVCDALSEGSEGLLEVYMRPYTVNELKMDWIDQAQKKR